MQLVIFNLFYSHGLKGGKSDVQGDLGNFNSASANLFEDPGCEMQARGWRRHGAPRLRIDSLVALAVRHLVGVVVFAMVVLAMMVATNVGRKRNVPNTLDACEEIGHGSEADAAFAKITAADHLGLDLGLKSGRGSFGWVSGCAAR